MFIDNGRNSTCGDNQLHKYYKIGRLGKVVYHGAGGKIKLKKWCKVLRS